MQDPEGTTGASTEKRLLSSVVASLASQLGRTVIRLGAELILARLLLPGAHGVFDRALGIVLIVSACRDLGLLYQVVRDERQPFGPIRIWVLSAGAVLSLALSLLSPLFLFLDPDLPAVLQVLAFAVFLDALGAVPRVFFERSLQVKALVAPEILRGLVWSGVSISLAWGGLGVWSFVVAELLAHAFYAGLLWRRAWGRIPADPGLDLLPDLLRRSFLLFLVWLPSLSLPLVGRFVIEESAMAGHFNKGYLWALRLQALVVPALVRVLYPAFVEYRRDHRRFVAAYRLGTLSILALECLAAHFLFWNAPLVIRLLLGEQWGATVPLLRILAFLPLVDPLTRLGVEVLKARGEDRALLAIVSLNLISLVLFGLLFTPTWGASGMAWAHYLMLGNGVMVWRMYHVCGSELWRLMKQLLLLYLIPAPCFAVAAFLFSAGSWPRFGASLAATAISGAMFLAWLGPPLRAFFVAPPEADEAPGACTPGSP